MAKLLHPCTNPSPEKQKLKKVKETGENRCFIFIIVFLPGRRTATYFLLLSTG